MNDRMLRVPPHSTEAEQAVLGALMLSPAAWDKVEGRLTPEDFYRHDHAEIFRAIAALQAKGTPPDAVTLSDWFAAEGADRERVTYVCHLANNTPSAASIHVHAKIVRERAELRRLIDGLSTAVAAAYEPGAEVEALRDRTIGGLMKAARGERSAEWTLRQALNHAWEDISAAYAAGGGLVGVPTGLIDLDQMLGGLHDSDLIAVGARPSIGKTALLFGWAAYAAEQGYPIGIFSSEQPRQQLAIRMMASKARVSAVGLRNAQLEQPAWAQVTHAIAELGALKVWIYDRPSPRLAELSRIARQWKRQHGIKALYVDYLQRIVGPGEKRHEQVAAVAIGLKDLARELNIPIVTLAQVKREVDQRSDKRPRMGDLCDSSEIEKEADQVLTLYRDDYYHADSKDAGTAEILIDKNRHGETGFVRVSWLPSLMRFDNLGGDRYEDLRGPAAAPVRGYGNPGADKAAA